MGLLSRARELLSGRRSRALARARRREAEGRLEEATALYLEGEEPDEAVRLLSLRADSALDPATRLSLLAQAAGRATGERSRELELRRRRLMAELVKESKLDLTRPELRDLADRLGALGDPSLAAELYALMGDSDAQARMLVQAGAIEKLENVLDAEERRERAERQQSEIERRVRDFLSLGLRRKAIAEGATLRTADTALAVLLDDVLRKKITGPRVRLELDGVVSELVFGHEILIGRAGATLTVASPAVSREHLVIRRGASGPEIADLGSSNGTLLSGVRIDAPLPVGEGIQVFLGGEVAVRVSPSDAGAVRIELGDDTLIAPLGPFSVLGCRISPGADGWLELVATAPLFLAGLRVSGGIELCHGDSFSVSAGDAARLRLP
jgi:FHA domain